MLLQLHVQKSDISDVGDEQRAQKLKGHWGRETGREISEGTHMSKLKMEKCYTHPGHMSLGITQTYYLTFTASADVILTTWFCFVVVVLFLRNFGCEN